MSHPNTKNWHVFPGLLLGIVAFLVLVASQSAPERKDNQERSYAVRTIKAPLVNFIPRTIGYGYVEPNKTWEAVAQVTGQVATVSSKLKKGRIVQKGQLLVKIAKEDYELAAAQIQANIQSTMGELQQLEIKEQNARVALAIEKNSLKISKKEADRKAKLARNGSLSKASADQEQRNYLQQKQNVQNQQNTLNLIPAEKAVSEAKLASYQAQLKDAMLDLARTEIKAPFWGRMADVKIEADQYVQTGQVLAIVDSISVAEISAQIPVDKFLSLLPPSGEDEVDIQQISMAQFLNQPTGLYGENLMPKRKLFNIEAIVRLQTGSKLIEWPAKFARMDASIDPKTRTGGVVVSVDKPYEKANPPERPALVKDMYCQVELIGQAQPDTIVLPISALHNGNQVYVVDEENRLEKRDIEVGLFQDTFFTIDEGIEESDTVIVSDVVPAVTGMLLIPQEDNVLLESLIEKAEGKQVKNTLKYLQQEFAIETGNEVLTPEAGENQ